MKKVIIVQVVILVSLLGAFVAYKWTKSNQKDIPTQVLLQTGRVCHHFASLKRKDNELILGNINMLVKEVENNLGVKLDYAPNGNRIAEQTNKVLVQLEKVRQETINATGAMDDDEIVGGRKIAKYPRETFLTMLAAIKTYADSLTVIAEMERSPLALYNLKGDTIAIHQFAAQFLVEKPLAIFLYNLARLEIDIIAAETEALKSFGKKVNYLPLEFNEPVVVAVPFDTDIMEGEEFSMEIYARPKLTSHRPSGVLVDDKPVPIENGYVKATLKPDGRVKKDGKQLVRNWEAIYLITTSNGTATYATKDKFIVEQ